MIAFVEEVSSSLVREFLSRKVSRFVCTSPVKSYSHPAAADTWKSNLSLVDGDTCSGPEKDDRLHG